MPTRPTHSVLPAPHGGELIELEIVPRIPAHKGTVAVELTPRQMADLEMISIGAYSPLRTFMDERDWRSVLETSHLSNGTLWPIPITFQVPLGVVDDTTSDLHLLKDGVHIASLTVDECFTVDFDQESQAVYGTTSLEHPGVAALHLAGPVAVSGRLAIHSLIREFKGPEYLTPAEARTVFALRGWRTIVAFQTRNPVHRAHEYLHKVALEVIDGLFLNPLVGQTKDDDVPADVRMEAYAVLLKNYYPSDRALLAVYPAAMRYAGPKEAVLHAISRKNYGCTHFIVGRDHAGVGDYYGTYAAQEIFETFEHGEVGIEIIKFEHSFFCTWCEQVVSKRTCPHGPESHLTLSGTKVRQLLAEGSPLPSQFSRPEVAEVLRRAYARP